MNSVLPKIDSFDWYNFMFYNYYQPQGKIMLSEAYVSHSVHNRPYVYSVTAHPCYGVVGTHPTGMLSCYFIIFFTISHIHSTSTWQLSFMKATEVNQYFFYLKQNASANTGAIQVMPLMASG